MTPSPAPGLGPRADSPRNHRARVFDITVDTPASPLGRAAAGAAGLRREIRAHPEVAPPVAVQVRHERAPHDRGQSRGGLHPQPRPLDHAIALQKEHPHAGAARAVS